MIGLAAALGCLVASAILALALWSAPRWSARCGAAGPILGSAIGMVPAAQAFVGVPVPGVRWDWAVPYGSLHLGLDPLSGLFLLAIFFVSGVAAWYGLGSLPTARRSQAAGWFWYDVLVASMALVVVARNAVLFLLAWEVMAISSFFLVTQDAVRDDGEVPGVNEAGWVYLVASHLGTAFLFVLFLLLGESSPSLDFDDFAEGGARSGIPSAVFFGLALVGFGTKAGFVPLHVWLPEAHPVAPSHVSAVMSGVMIKTGLYGLFRTLTWLGEPPAWWGYILVGVGLTSGVVGVLFALVQHNLKRLLAYHSVENIGIIALGAGIGLIGQAEGMPVVAALGWAGALLHVINHALFKALLFLAAGSVAHGSGTLDIEELGGLGKRMRWTANLFLLGAVAISGLPPLNGFISELVVYLGLLSGVAAPEATTTTFLATGGLGLALIGGLAAACFAKAYGMVFLGEPRTEHGRRAHEGGVSTLGPMLVLGLGCVAIAFLGWGLLGSFAPVLRELIGLDPDPALEQARHVLTWVTLSGAALVALLALLAGGRWWLLRGRVVGEEGTWGCGYLAPTPRMQYSATSFAAPLTELFSPVLRPHTLGTRVEGYFPKTALLTTHTPDVARVLGFAPLYRGILWVSGRLRAFQQGRVQLYVLYIAITLLVLLVTAL